MDPTYIFEEIGCQKHSFKYVLNKIPSLGLAYLASMVEKEGHKVNIVDGTLCPNLFRLKEDTLHFNPQIIGITATTPTFKKSVHITNILREVMPEAVFICGGPHPTACPDESLNENVFDFIVIGEGEQTFLELVSYIDNSELKDIYNIAGIGFRENGNVKVTAPRKEIRNLDSIPFPARHLLPELNRYKPTPASYRKLPLAVIITTRGCPNQCIFCDRSVFGEKLRKRSINNIMSEVDEAIYLYKAKEIRFFDDTFTVDYGHVENICKEMKKFYPSVPWTCLTNVNYIDYNILKLLRESGCWQVLFGLESGDEYILEHLGKGNTLEKNKKAVMWAKKAGLKIRADFLIGTPWETKSTLRKTVDFAKNLPLDFAHFNKFVPYPGTKIYKDLISEGYEFKFDERAFIDNQTETIYVPPAFTELEYLELLNRAYKEFYFRPGYLLRKLCSIKTFPELIGHVKGMCSIISL